MSMAKIISYLYIAILSLAIAGCSDSDSLDANNTPNSNPGSDETLPGDEGASTTDRTDERPPLLQLLLRLTACDGF